MVGSVKLEGVSLKENLKVEKLEDFGAVHKVHVDKTEISLIKRLSKDIQQNFSSKYYQNKKEKPVKTDSIKQISSLQKILTKYQNKKTKKQKSTISLNTDSIQDMRGYEKMLRDDLKIIQEAIKDSKNLLQYEQEETTKDISTIIQFLSDFIHILEINISDGEISRYIPIEYKNGFRILLEEAHEELDLIAELASKAIDNELLIHNHKTSRSKLEKATPERLEELLHQKLHSHKMLHSRITHFKRIMQEINDVFDDIKKLSKSTTSSMQVPMITEVATKASVELELLQESATRAIKNWPLKDIQKEQMQRTINNSYNSIKSLVASTKAVLQEQKRDTHHHSQARMMDNHKVALTQLNKVLRILKTAVSEKSSKIQLKNLLNDLTDDLIYGVEENILSLANKHLKFDFNDEEQKHKKSIYDKFAKIIRALYDKSDHFYDAITHRLNNSSEIISLTLEVEKRLADELHDIHLHLREFYSHLISTHRFLAEKHDSDYKKRLHHSFADELIEREDDLAGELKDFCSEIDSEIVDLIQEIPKHKMESETVNISNRKKLKHDAVELSNLMKHAASMIGATEAN